MILRIWNSKFSVAVSTMSSTWSIAMKVFLSLIFLPFLKCISMGATGSHWRDWTYSALLVSQALELQVCATAPSLLCHLSAPQWQGWHSMPGMKPQSLHSAWTGALVPWAIWLALVGISLWGCIILILGLCFRVWMLCCYSPWRYPLVDPGRRPTDNYWVKHIMQ